MTINQCVIEFEEACSGLRSAEAADAELRWKMQQRGPKQQLVAGDGMLLALIKEGQLSDEAFVDVVRKIKLAFNLLVRASPFLIRFGSVLDSESYNQQNHLSWHLFCSLYVRGVSSLSYPSLMLI